MLDDLGGVIDWAPVERLLAGISSAAKGESAWPPLALLKAMLLSVWYDPSDVKLAEARDDRSSFRRFCGFSSSEPTLERTAFVRFRKALVERQPDKVLFNAITAQLKAKAIRVKAGTLVEATITASASEDDGEAHWVKHTGKAAVYGIKAHDDPSEVFADSAYQGGRFGDAVRAKGGVPRIVANGMWGRDEAETFKRLCP